MMSQRNALRLLALVTASAAIWGCADSSAKRPDVHQSAAASHSDDSKAADDGWWCAEHGVPESMCALCDAKIAADYKAKGDWCAKHDRPDSQCFICHPEKEAVFAAMYEAKYNEAPPKREEEKK